MPKRILVALDGSAQAECALPHALAMAHVLAAQIDLLLVVEPIAPPVEGMSSVDPLSWRFKKNEAEVYLSAIKTQLDQHTVGVTKTLLEGRAAEQIIKMAHDTNADLLILSCCGQHETDSKRSAFSPTVSQVLQQHSISTLIVRVDQPIVPNIDGLHYTRVMVPLDGSRRAEAVLPTATLLAQTHNAELLLVHVVSAPDMARRMPLSPEDSQLARQLVERNQAEGEQYLAQLQIHLPGNVRTLLQISDHVAVTLQDIVEHENIDLMILGAHGYSGASRWPYGSITNRFISDGSIPLLVVQDLANELPELQMTDSNVRQLGR